MRSGEGAGGPSLAAVGALVLGGIAALAVAAVERAGWLIPLFAHGIDPSGRPWVQRFGPGEPVLFAVQLLVLPAAVAAGVALAGAAPIAWVDRSIGRHPGRWRLGAAVLAAALALGWSAMVLHGTPITDDEDVYLFQARIFASGYASLPSPEPREAFEAIFVIDDGRWFGQYPPGHSMVLAAGVKVGAVHWLPPLLLALAVWWLSGAAGRLLGPREGAVTAILAGTSPFLTVVAGTLLSQTTSLAVLALGLLAGVRAAEERRRGMAVLAGLALGFSVLVRPASAVLVGGPLALVFLPRLLRSREGRPLVAGFVGGGAAMGVLWLAMNRVMTGSALVSPYMAYWLPLEGLRSPFGFGDFPWGIHHTVGVGLGNLWRNAVRLDGWLTGWPFVLAVAVAGWLRARRRPGVDALAAAAIVAPLVYIAYFWPGIPDVGPLLWEETALGWIPLAAAFLAGGDRERRRRGLGFLLGATVLGWLVFVPPVARALEREAWEAGRLERAVRRVVGDEEVVVFTPMRPRGPNAGSWRLGRPLPNPDLSDRCLFLLAPPSRAAARQVVQRYFPGRQGLMARWDRRRGFVFTRIDSP